MWKIRALLSGKFLLALIICISCGGAFGYLIGRSVVLNLSELKLTKISEHAAQMTDSYVADMQDVIAAMKRSPYLRCSTADVEYMRKVVLRSFLARDAGRLSGDHIECSAILGKDGYAGIVTHGNVVETHGLRVYRNMTPYSEEDKAVFALVEGDIFVARDPSVAEYLHKTNYPFFIAVFNDATGHWERLNGNEPTFPISVLSHPGQGIYKKLVYATRCSDVLGECAVSYASIPEELSAMRSVACGSAAGGLLIGALLGLMVSFLIMRKQSLAQQLRQAIAHDRLFLAYQPIVDLATRRVTGAEALVRWTDPKGVPVPPEMFVALAERHGFTRELAHWVLQRALDEFAPILRSHSDFRLSVNVAAIDLVNDSFLQSLKERTRKEGLVPGNLAIEITERSTAQGTAAAAIKQLREAGYRVHIDDFGTGYSSLSYLHELAVDAIKLDKSFTHTIGTEAIVQCVIPQILSMAKSLHLEVIVEGIETEVQVMYFCDYKQPIFAQGWLFGHPVSAREFHQLIEEDREQWDTPKPVGPASFAS